MAQQADYRGKVDLWRVEGDSLGQYTFKFRTSAAGVDPATYEDLTGATIAATFKQGTTTILECTTANGMAGLSDTETIFLTATPAQAADLVQGKYYYDVQITYADGTVRTRVYGTLSVARQQTT